MFPSLFQDCFQNVYDTTKEGGPGARKKGDRDGDLGDLWQETPLWYCNGGIGFLVCYVADYFQAAAFVRRRVVQDTTS
jgi:hypothetical protein